MLCKLLKHDFKAIFRYWWIIAITTVGAALLGGGAIRFIIDYSDMVEPSFLLNLIYLAALLVIFVSMIVIVASLIVTYILVYYRFYKNFFTDEGYLTFTLPVSRRKLFLSKTLNALIYTTLQIVLYVIAIGIIIFFASPESFAESLSYLPEIFDEMMLWFGFESMGAWKILYAMLTVAIFAFSLFYGTSFIHLCITVGSVIAKKHKLLASIGVYYATNMLTSMFGEIFLLILVGAVSEPLVNIATSPSESLVYPTIALVLLVVCGIIATLAFTVYSVTQHLIDRKLNLA